MSQTYDRDKLLSDTLHFIAQQGWLETGKPFPVSLVEFLGKSLDVEYVLIDELMPSGTRAKTIALFANGSVVHDIEYDLENTPCENVMDKRLCVYSHDLQSCFPNDELLVTMKAESYMGIPLWDSKGTPLGLIAILDKRSFHGEDVMKEVLQLVALRTAHELERRRDSAKLTEYYSQLEATVKERTTDLQKAYDGLAEANAEINIINDKLNIVSGITRHDISNQIMALKGNLLLLQQYQADNRVKELCSRMERSVDIISRTIEIARDYETTGVNAPCWQEIAPLLYKLPSSIVSVDPSLHGLSLFADPLLEKVFFNLLNNSEKHGGNVDRIEVHCIREKDGLRLVWQDNGKGIPIHKEGTLFRSPSNNDRVHGLFLIHKILNLTGIDIEETGIPGTGARFEMIIPSNVFRYSIE